MFGAVSVYDSNGSLIGNFTSLQAAVDFAGSKAGSDKTIVVDGLSSDGVTPNPPFSEQVVVNAAAAGALASMVAGARELRRPRKNEIAHRMTMPIIQRTNAAMDLAFSCTLRM